MNVSRALCDGRRLSGLLLQLAAIAGLAQGASGNDHPKPGQQHRSQSGWIIHSTQNFRILSYGPRQDLPQVGECCEALRRELCERWLGAASADWSPKCDVVLHPNDGSYLRAAGSGAGSTVASSLIDQQRGRITVRRIDVRLTRRDWQTGALPHEMTHVVMADGFTLAQLPRWIDEGVAILADPVDKQQRHLQDFRTAQSHQLAFRVGELMMLEGYPAMERWGAFYGQSASLVRFLVERETPAEFTRFARLSVAKGYDAALKEVYQLNGILELERAWRRELQQSRPDKPLEQFVSYQTPANRPSATSSAPAR